MKEHVGTNDAYGTILPAKATTATFYKLQAYNVKLHVYNYLQLYNPALHSKSQDAGVSAPVPT